MKTVLSALRNMNLLKVTFGFKGDDLLAVASNNKEALKFKDAKGDTQYVLMNTQNTSLNEKGASFPFTSLSKEDGATDVSVGFQIQGNNEREVKLNAARALQNLEPIEKQIIASAKEINKAIDSIKFDTEGGE